jgi:hypothetical protein
VGEAGADAIAQNLPFELGEDCEQSGWFRQLELAPFDGLIWPHPEGM